MTWKFNVAVASVERNSEGVVVTVSPAERRQPNIAQGSDGSQHRFDRIIFACPAEVALKALRRPSFMEKKVLGGVRYFNDLTVTHTDESYMNRSASRHG